jgi:hypothetical protein
MSDALYNFGNQTLPKKTPEFLRDNFRFMLEHCHAPTVDVYWQAVCAQIWQQLGLAHGYNANLPSGGTMIDVDLIIG